MTISALLSPQKIFLDTEVTSKKKLLELMANIVADRSQLAQSTIYNNLLNRERLGSTGLGRGIAVPHARVPDLEQTIGCFFRLKEPVNFESPDNQPVDLVFTIVIPEEATEEHLLILSSLARIFSQADVARLSAPPPARKKSSKSFSWPSNETFVKDRDFLKQYQRKLKLLDSLPASLVWTADPDGDTRPPTP